MPYLPLSVYPKTYGLVNLFFDFFLWFSVPSNPSCLFTEKIHPISGFLFISVSFAVRPVRLPPVLSMHIRFISSPVKLILSKPYDPEYGVVPGFAGNFVAPLIFFDKNRTNMVFFDQNVVY